MEYSAEFYTGDTYERFLEIERRNRVVESSTNTSGGRVLDIGPGGMKYYDCIVPWSTYTIVDPVQEFIDQAPSHVTGICSKFEDAKIEGFFEFIIISGMLHIVEDRNLFLKKVYSLCHADTLIHINVPNAESFHRILGWHMGLIDNIRDRSKTDIIYNHGKNFTMDDLTLLLNNNNFYVKHIDTYQLKPFADAQMTKILNKDIINGLNCMVSYFSTYGCEIIVEAKINTRHK